jgi:UDP-N-acetylglucosamine 2-epimerase (non-hydrolysing)
VIHCVEPLTHRRLLGLVAQCAGVITDSGGLQKEAYILGVACTTVRPETEWTETLVDGWNALCWDDLGQLVPTALRGTPTMERARLYGNGDAAHILAELLLAMRPGSAALGC